MSDIDTIKKLLPNSEVFPKVMREMLLKNIDSLGGQQLKKLLIILKEEKEKLHK